MNEARVIARCAKCGREVLANGLCADAGCSPPELAVERLRRFVKPRAAGSGWRTRDGRRRLEIRDHLAGQDAALPVGDRD